MLCIRRSNDSPHSLTSSGEILQNKKKHNPKQNVNILKQILKLLETRSVMHTGSLSYLNAACVVYNVAVYIIMPKIRSNVVGRIVLLFA